MGTTLIHATGSRTSGLSATAPTYASTTPPNDPSPSPSPSESLREGAEAAVEATVSVLGVLGAIALGVLAGIVAALLVQFMARAIFRRRRVVLTAAHPALRPLRFLLAILFGWLGFVLAFPPAEGNEVDPVWRGYVMHLFLVLFIGGSTWLIASLTLGIQEVLLRRVRSYSQSRYRKVQTQLQVLNRAIAVVIWLLGLAAILMTFPVARTAGASVFASAGLISVVAGIAAQSTLGNLFAGLQLAFSDSIRVDDIIVWKTEYTKVEEITLTYVVLKVWDGRRLIVPSKELTSQTFENWTRRAPEMLGYVDLQVDWSVSIPDMRAELERVLSRTDLWDGEIGIIQVRDVESGILHISALVSAENPSTLIDLKFYVREQLVRWIQQVGAHEGAQPIADDEDLQRLGKLRMDEAAGGDGVGAEVAGAGADDGAGRIGADAWAADAAGTGGRAAAVAGGQAVSATGERADASDSDAAAGWQPSQGEEGSSSPQQQGAEQAAGAGAAAARASDDDAARGSDDTGSEAAEAAGAEARQKTSSGVLPAGAQAAQTSARGGVAEETELAKTKTLPTVRIPIAERWTMDEDAGQANLVETGYESSIFSGSIGAERRAKEFSGPGEAAMREREEAARKREAREAEYASEFDDEEYDDKR